MSNMSYCRYNNTRSDLNDCISDCTKHVDMSAEYKVSDSEVDQFRGMVEEMVEFLLDLELIDEHGELDCDRLDDVCKSMREVGV